MLVLIISVKTTTTIKPIFLCQEKKSPERFWENLNLFFRVADSLGFAGRGCRLSAGNHVFILQRYDVPHREEILPTTTLMGPGL